MTIRSIVITGSEGFIGRELARHCDAAGMKQALVDRTPSEGGKHLCLDVRSPDLADAIPEGADALIHLAGTAMEVDCRADVPEAVSNNVDGTLNSIKAAAMKGVRRFIFASSEWIYGECRESDLKPESFSPDLARVSSVYAMTKLFTEFGVQSSGNPPPRPI